MSGVRPRILIVDDEPFIREFLGEILSSEYQVNFAPHGESALEVIKRNRPSLIVLDLLMPQMGGIKLCETLKGDPNLKDIPVVILSGLNDHVSRMEAFSVGAADFIHKPFHPDELLLRVKMKLNPNDIPGPVATENKKLLTCGNISINKQNRSLKIKQKEFFLLDIEASILEYLILHVDEICSREEIADAVWTSGEAINPRNLDPHISALRKKIKSADHTIQTIYGSGYILKKV